jgi:hypothetical protein
MDGIRIVRLQGTADHYPRQRKAKGNNNEVWQIAETSPGINSLVRWCSSRVQNEMEIRGSL